MKQWVFLLPVIFLALFPFQTKAQQSGQSELVSRHEVQGFIFEKRRLSVENMRVPEDPLTFRTVHEFKITDAETGGVLFSFAEEFCADVVQCESDPGICDFNFDGYPDLRVLLEREPARYVYYVYVSGKKRFEKHPFSDLFGQEWNEASRTARGYFYEYGFPKTSPVARIDRVYRKSGLKEVSDTKTPVAAGTGE